LFPVRKRVGFLASRTKAVFPSGFCAIRAQEDSIAPLPHDCAEIPDMRVFRSLGTPPPTVALR
jgi:hypothetical protein